MGRGFESRSSRGRRRDDSSDAESDDASTSGSESDEWVLEGTSEPDVESGGWDVRRDGRDRARGGPPPRRGASRGELEPILKTSRFAAYGDAHRPAPPARFDDEADAFLARRAARPRTSILAAVASVAVLAVACVTLATTTTPARHHSPNAESARPDGERATLSGHARAANPATALRRDQHPPHPHHHRRRRAPEREREPSSRIRTDATDDITLDEAFGVFAASAADAGAVHRDHVLAAPSDGRGASSVETATKARGATRTPTEMAADAAAKAGLIIPRNRVAAAEMGTFADDVAADEDLNEDASETSTSTGESDPESDSESSSKASKAAERLANVKLLFAALGDGAAGADSSVARRDASTVARRDASTVARRDSDRREDAPRRRYLVGLTTSAGFGDQFKRVSTYAAMARELDRTLVLWPVFTSPHYALDGEGEGPLHFDDYVRIAGEGATDAEGRLVSYRDAPARVRDFPRRNPAACLTSNDNPNPVQFLTSRNLSDAVVAPVGKRRSYEALVRAMRFDADQETVCVAATFSSRDYDKPSHGEDAAAWRALDFRPRGKFEHYWANAVDSLRAAAEERKERMERRTREGGLRAGGETEGPGEGSGASGTLGGAETSPTGSVLADPTPTGTGTPTPTPPKFRVTPAYTALHWRRGDKCGRKSKRQRARRDARVRFDGNATGSSAALMCDDYAEARVLDLCEAMPPVYVATDDDDPAFVAHLRSRGCFLSSDLKLGAPRHKLTDVDLLMVDVMLVAGAEVSLTFGHTALARLYDRMRMSRGLPRSINVAADASAFGRAYERAMAGAGASAAAAASLGGAKDTLFVDETGTETKAGKSSETAAGKSSETAEKHVGEGAAINRREETRVA